ncbi:MAG: hypothetical protein AAB210_04060 [Deltaproteobacteria bacterium]
MTFLTALIFFFLVAGGVVLVLWIAMSFSVFAMKDEMKGLKKELEKTNKLLDAILEKTGNAEKKKEEDIGHG